MKNLLCLFVLSILFLSVSHADTHEQLVQRALDTLNRAVTYFYSINTHGGYVYYITPDLSQRWGESPADAFTIEVQPPGTPAVGQTFLRAYEVTGNTQALQAATDAAFALIRGQNELSGWEHTIRFNRPKRNRVSFDDNQTQSVIRFLMALDQHIDHDSLTMAINKALDMMLTSQLDHGGWPHVYPTQNNYHDYATFNDRGINDCIDVMMDAFRFYKKDAYKKSLAKAGRFLVISQLPPPQPGWAQQYNEFLQPAWARSFEPPSVCTLVTVNNINTLIDLYLFTSQNHYLEPIPDALRWLDAVRLENGKWPRFVELTTNEPLYYDRGRIRVNSVDELHIERRTGYGYETHLLDRLNDTKKRFNAVKQLGASGYLKKQAQSLTKDERLAHLAALQPQVEQTIQSMDAQGRWVTKNDRYKKHRPGKTWNGEFEIKDRVSSAVFNQNVRLLCDYIETARSLFDQGF